MQGDRDVNTADIVIADECDVCQSCQRGEQRARRWTGCAAVDGPSHGQDLGDFEPKRDGGPGAARYGRDGRPAIAEGDRAAATADDAASGGRWQGAPSGYAGKCEPGVPLTILTQVPAHIMNVNFLPVSPRTAASEQSGSPQWLISPEMTAGPPTVTKPGSSRHSR